MVTIIHKGASKKTIQDLLDQQHKKNPRKGIDAKKYCGQIQLSEDPLLIQKRLRNEWE